MRTLATGVFSEVRPAPPRESFQGVLVAERSRTTFAEEPEVLDVLEADGRRGASLGLPWRRVLEVRRERAQLVVIREHFIGLSGAELVEGLKTHRRLLPLDVWLTVAAALLAAEEGHWGPASGGGLRSFGFDFQKRLLVFADPQLHFAGQHLEEQLPPAPRIGNLLARARFLSPEHLRGSPTSEASRVFAAATVLCELLTTTPAFSGASTIEAMRQLALGQSRWSAELHPEAPMALEQTLRRALLPDVGRRWPLLAEFREALLKYAGVTPAPMERAAAVWLGVDIPQWRAQLAEVAQSPEWLPRRWRQGGLQVLEDTLLEIIPTPERLPCPVG